MKTKAESLLTRDGIPLERYFLVGEGVYSIGDNCELVTHLIEREEDLSLCVSYLQSIGVPCFERLSQAFEWLKEQKSK